MALQPKENSLLVRSKDKGRAQKTVQKTNNKTKNASFDLDEFNNSSAHSNCTNSTETSNDNDNDNQICCMLNSTIKSADDPQDTDISSSAKEIIA